MTLSLRLRYLTGQVLVVWPGDCNGLLVGILADSVEGIVSCVDAEGVAVLDALRLGEKKKWMECIFEAGSTEVYNLIYMNSCSASNDSCWLQECSNMFLNNQRSQLAFGAYRSKPGGRLLLQKGHWQKRGVGFDGCYSCWSFALMFPNL